MLLSVFVSGCSSIRYYSHLAQGQWSLWSQRQSIETLLEQDDLDQQLKGRLEQVQAIRLFASSHLDLVDNNSYRYYTDLKRPYAVWNVFAAPQFSITPIQWCFPMAGCVSYRGYFSKTSAIEFANTLAKKGMDTYVAGVAAYSTLGWFDDPVLNTFIYSDNIRLGGLIFHELAHQQLYLAGDTTFNESFARCIEIEGVKLWLQTYQHSSDVDHYLQQQRMESDFVDIVLVLQKKLAQLYRQTLPDKEKRRGKQQFFDDFLKQQYPMFKARWNGYTGFDYWVKSDPLMHNLATTRIKSPVLNNAKLSTIASYHQWLRAFQQLLLDSGGNFNRFYQRARHLSQLHNVERQQALERLDRRAKTTLLLH